MGRPSDFTQELADLICERLADGESLRNICDSENMPSRTTVFRWIAANTDFRNQYACAREAQADFYAESTIDISDEEVTMIKRSKHGGKDDEGDGDLEVVFDPTAVARNRLRVDARKWYAAKLAPKKYGDKMQTELTGANGGPVEFTKIVREIVKA